MKKVLVGLVLALSLGVSTGAKAQVNVNINIGAQPVWGPVGYDYVEYYYLPDIEAYYYVPSRQFVYLSGGNWVFAYSLPVRYRTYDLYSGYKVVINQPKAYKYFTTHKMKYAGYRGNRSQVIIRNSNEPKYYVVKGHPKFKGKPAKAGGKPAGKGKGNGKGRH